jgi:hypothetical protein
MSRSCPGAVAHSFGPDADGTADKERRDNVMRHLADLADRVEIDVLRGEFSDAAMMNNHERLGSLFTSDGAVRIPHGGIDAIGPAQIRDMGNRRENLAACFIQNTHPGTLEIDGDTASGRVYVYELFQLRDGTSHVNYAVYHDRYRRTSDGWRFAERVYQVMYQDSTPLPGMFPNQSEKAGQTA